MIGYTTQSGHQSFAYRRVCRCIRFRFHASRFPYFVHPFPSLLLNTHNSRNTHNATHNREAVQTVLFLDVVVQCSSSSWGDIMAAHILQVVTECEARLLRLLYVPRFSYERGLVCDDGAPNRLFFNYLFSDQAMAIQFMKEIGLLRSKVQCNTDDSAKH